jgi:hypothetical protein
MHAAINKFFTSFEFFSVLCSVAIYMCSNPFLVGNLSHTNLNLDFS